MTNLIILFTVLTILNVILSTVKSIVTIKGNAFGAALISAIYYGFYTIVLIYTVTDFPIEIKVLVTGLSNLIGVYIVKRAEEKARKEKLWKVEVTIPSMYTDVIDKKLEKVPHSYITLSDKHTLFNFYCPTQKESQEVKDIVNFYGAKYFVAESKTL